MTSPNPITKQQETAIKKLRLPWRLIITGILAATSVFAYPTLRNVLLEDTSESTTSKETASLAIDKSKTAALP
ncbi:MAG: efflux RND transporter periplasmic adaptor subunit, partial [Microcystis sp. M53600_WE12]|nr:efflux RND transporter periplasmic adaptor subunit [Microcystis sp. M53600_WE12]